MQGVCRVVAGTMLEDTNNATNLTLLIKLKGENKSLSLVFVLFNKKDC